MTTLSWILAICVAIAAAAGVYISAAAARRPMKQWTQRIMTAKTDEAVQAVGEAPNVPTNESGRVAMKRYRKAMTSIADTRELEEAEQREVRFSAKARAQLALDRAISDDEERRTAFADWMTDYDTPKNDARRMYHLDVEDKKFVQDELRGLAQQRAASLLEQARHYNTLSLCNLIDLIGRGKRSDYFRQAGEPYDYPADWNELVAKLIKNPSLADFNVSGSDPAPGDIRLRTAHLIQETSVEPIHRLSEAKILLAYSKLQTRNGYYWREEIGAVMMAELPKLVVQLQQELGLTYTRITMTT